MARKTTYTKQVADLILQQFACGDTIVQSCLNNGVKHSTFYFWLSANHDDLKERYEGAKLSHAENLSHQLDELILSPLSDEEKEHPIAFKRRELYVKKKQWELEKRHRHLYGNHVTVEKKHTIDLAPILKRLNDKQAQREAMRVIEDTKKPLELTKLSNVEQYTMK
ncbi:terminase small subunit-like protein, partial [Candidatus Liberibacter solanacearum]|uniref:terminase small subunit-like protein n=2 Tax=Candidatus Liberibacter solanacearum TaxID=556287 RepID=UPI00387DCDB4